MNTNLLLLSVLWGAIGSGYFIYGKRQKSYIPLIVGIALIVFPYFVSNTLLSIFLGTTLVISPYFIKSR